MDWSIVYDSAQDYACLHWCDHFLWGLTQNGDDNVLSSPLGTSLTSDIMDFASWTFDFWVNTVIYQEELQQIVNILGSVLSLLQVSWIFFIERRI